MVCNPKDIRCQRSTKKIFVCSPFAGDVEGNVKVTRLLCRMVLDAGHVPFAPHLMYPGVVDDAIPGERKRGIEAGLEFMAHCDEVWAYADGLISSPGMQVEVENAVHLGLPVHFFCSIEGFKGFCQENQILTEG